MTKSATGQQKTTDLVSLASPPSLLASPIAPDLPRCSQAVRGCIVADTAVLSLVIVEQGEGGIPGLTDNVSRSVLVLSVATRTRKFFNLTN